MKSGQTYFSDLYYTMLGYEPGELPMHVDTWATLVHPDDMEHVLAEVQKSTECKTEYYMVEKRMKCKDGSYKWVRAAGQVVTRDVDGTPRRMLGVHVDIHDMKKAQEEMRQMIETDMLTGLVSRILLMERINHALARNRRYGTFSAALFFDFDRFKTVNDSLGHENGDLLLRSIAKRLKANIREIDTASRIGGDEFVILLEDLKCPADANKVAQKLLTICDQPYDIEGHLVVCTASIGVATNEHENHDASTLLQYADAAMYEAKAAGRSCYAVFDASMYEKSVERIFIERELRHAISGKQMSLHYQPVVDLETGELVSAEALARWTHPQLGFVSPGDFIPIAEDTNQISALGNWVIDEACEQLSEWKARDVLPEDFAISINVSKMQLLTPNFVRHLEQRVKSHGLEPRDIKIEVTETTIIDNRSGIRSVLEEMRERSFIIMMDDFGTGHSSLSGLHKLPLDELKIDQSFIRSEETSVRLSAITSAIVMLADQLDLRTVGEGIETIEHVALLQEMGCNLGQGYFFAKPLPADEFETWVQEQRKQRAA